LIDRVHAATRDIALNLAGFLLVLLATALLGVFVRSGIEQLLAWRKPWPALVFALVSGVVWAAAFGSVRKEQLRNPEGRILPLPTMAFLLGSALVWVYLFAGLSYALVRVGLVEYGVAQNSEALLGVLTDAYMWHFLDLVPGLRITEALGWKAPLDLQGGTRGPLLLLFRAAVIYQIFAKATSILKKDEPAGTGGTSPN
jgi:hypothetical protein